MAFELVLEGGGVCDRPLALPPPLTPRRRGVVVVAVFAASTLFNRCAKLAPPIPPRCRPDGLWIPYGAASVVKRPMTEADRAGASAATPPPPPSSADSDASPLLPSLPSPLRVSSSSSPSARDEAGERGAARRFEAAAVVRRFVGDPPTPTPVGLLAPPLRWMGGSTGLRLIGA